MKHPLPLLSVVMFFGSAASHAAAYDFDQSFFADYDKLVSVSMTPTRHDMMYVAPGALQRLARSNTITLDVPTVSTAVSSDLKDPKAADIAAIAALLRKDVDRGLTAAGFEIVDESRPGSIRARLSLTDLRLQKKKRNLLAYTPVGALLKTGMDATKNITEKYDVRSTAIQIELIDSATHEVLAQVVTIPDGRSTPMDFATINAVIQDFTTRLQRQMEEVRASLT